jgi:cardiolipin synthase
LTVQPLQDGHAITLLEGGASYFPALLEAMESSRDEIRLETYIFNFDVTGEQVAAALVRAALRGVAVYVVMDGIGTAEIPPSWELQFKQAGVQWCRFSPLGRFGLLIPGRWRRMHRKLCVVDSRVAFCGGINILDDHHDLNHGPQDSPRFDFAVRVTGPLVLDIHAAVLQFWVRLQVTRQLERLRFRGVRAVLQGQVKLAPSQQGTAAGLVLRDNLRNRNRIERAYRKAIGEARRDVLIANAYFLPGAKIRRALISAARRGVRVRLLLQGRYEYFMQYHAARPVYGALLEAGVEIYEYQTGFLHAKVAVVDGHWATVGSSNLDPLSLQLAREANVVVDDIAFAAALGERLELAIQQHGRQLDALAYAERPWRQRVLDRLAFGLMRLMLFLTGRRY